VRRRRRRRPAEREHLRLVVPARRNQRWSMDFASDALWTGRRFRCLCIVDDAIRERVTIQNAFVESFIGRFREGCLNQHWFGSLAEAARIVGAWREHYNRERPHSALGYEPPERFARPLGAPGFDEGPRSLPALAPAPRPCYDVNGSPLSRT
jgi:transposase InsO family protein